VVGTYALLVQRATDLVAGRWSLVILLKASQEKGILTKMRKRRPVPKNANE